MYYFNNQAQFDVICWLALRTDRLGFFVNPVLYEMVARDGDVLQV